MGLNQFTNKLGIPQHIVDAIIQDDHFTNGDISVTTLIDSPQIRMLKKIHSYDMDVSDLIAAFMGTGLHLALERADTSSADVRALKSAIIALERVKNQEKPVEYLNKFIEKYLEDKIDHNIMKEVNLTMVIDDFQISGTFDRFNISEGSLEDYKQCKVSAYTRPEFRQKWVEQLNIYAVMLRQEGLDVKKACVHAFLKDWSEMKIMTQRDYPKGIYQQFNIPLGDPDKVMSWIRGRVKLHKQAEETGQAVCTPKDMWAKASVFKVLKKGLKKSKKNCISHEQALSVIKELELKTPLDKGKFSVVEFPGGNLRCEKYCPVAQFCPQRKAELERQALLAQEM